MPAKEPSPLERTEVSFTQLATTAKNLNVVSDELSDVIDGFNVVLKQLNLGISAWVTITSKRDEFNDSYWSRDVGYAKVGRTWGIALREQSGLDYDPTSHECEVWLFADAPRWLRVEAVPKIPDLLQHLVSQADATIKRIQSKTIEAQALLEVVKKLSGENKGK